MQHGALAEVCAWAKAAVCSGERVDLHKGIRGPEAGHHCSGSGESGGRAVSEQPAGAAIRCTVPRAELPGLHEWPPAIPSGTYLQMTLKLLFCGLYLVLQGLIALLR